MWDKAVTYYQQVGARALERAAFLEAAAAFEQALVALQQLPKVAPRASKPLISASICTMRCCPSANSGLDP